jgi:hypothetical protein
MSQRHPAAAILALFAVCLFSGFGASPAMAVEEPPYTLVRADGDFEIRNYAPMVVAEVVVASTSRSPANDGFRPLANYIFGDNSPGAKIAMTAPVAVERGTKIAMTAPVERERGDAGWVVRFIMPAGSHLETMPTPNDPAVRLRAQPARRLAVVRFSGMATRDSSNAKEQSLRAWMARAGLQPAGEPIYAYYNPPWTPGFMRRNEVQIPIAP